MTAEFTSDEMMTVAAARSLPDGAKCFVGIGLPSTAANLARRTHAPGLVLIYESGTIGAKPDTLPLSIGDGVLAELLAPHANRYVCLDSSTKVVLAASERLRRLENVEVREGDMHSLPFAASQFDLVVLMHALTYAEHPAQAVAEAAR